MSPQALSARSTQHTPTAPHRAAPPTASRRELRPLSTQQRQLQLALVGVRPSSKELPRSLEHPASKHQAPKQRGSLSVQLRDLLPIPPSSLFQLRNSALSYRHNVSYCSMVGVLCDEDIQISSTIGGGGGFSAAISSIIVDTSTYASGEAISLFWYWWWWCGRGGVEGVMW